VHRVTGELGTWFGMDAGHLRVGDRADLVIIDPEHLDESVDRILEAPAEAFGGRARLVNRNDDAVVATYVAGTRLYGSGEFTADFGTRRTGRYLRAGETPEAVDPHQRVAAEPVAG
jgi:N-acyl-D-aspartate/D-glutamate deacylase